MIEIWAHRGASRAAPENTIPAFELAIGAGADGVEFDVQLSRDGHVVVIHDETLQRTTDGAGQVVAHCATTWRCPVPEAARRLAAGEGWETVEQKWGAPHA